MTRSPSEAFRAATREPHRRIETVPAMRCLLSSGLDRDAYRATLARLLGLLDPLETQLAGFGDVSAIGGRPRGPLLRRDLAALGMANRDIDALPRAAPPDWITDAPMAIGAAYVFEGARGGAPMILDRLFETLRLTPETGLGYFADLADPSRGGVSSVRASLDDWFAGRPDGDLADAIDSAVRTFESLHQWMLD